MISFLVGFTVCPGNGNAAQPTFFSIPRLGETEQPYATNAKALFRFGRRYFESHSVTRGASAFFRLQIPPVPPCLVVTATDFSLPLKSFFFTLSVPQSCRTRSPLRPEQFPAYPFFIPQSFGSSSSPEMPFLLACPAPTPLGL